MIGKILSAVWFILTGFSVLGVFTTPSVLMGILALLAGIFLIIGK